MGILVDTNVLLDLVTDDPVWGGWSLRQLEIWSLRGHLYVNAVIYAELSVGFRRIGELDKALAAANIEMLEIPRPALFLAGKAYKLYRGKRGAAKQGVLPDFFIGAHAAVAGIPLLTRDRGRYPAYFPKLDLIAP